MNHIRLPVDIERRALKLVATFRDELRTLIGNPRREFASIDVLQSVNGLTIDIEGDIAVVLVGPYATVYEPTLYANLAHELVHLHLTDGAYGNASGLEEGLALNFELSSVEMRYGSQERQHHVNHLPSTYATALLDYEKLLTISNSPATRVLEAHGKLTGVTAGELRRLFPTLGWWMSYRLARRKRMRPG